MAITFEEMIRRYTAIRDRADAVTQTRVRKARKCAELAGVGDSLGTTGHNAMISFRQGRPWPEIDYPMLRRAFWFIDKSFEPNRVRNRAYTRLYEQWRTDGFKYEPRA